MPYCQIAGNSIYRNFGESFLQKLYAVCVKLQRSCINQGSRKVSDIGRALLPTYCLYLSDGALFTSIPRKSVGTLSHCCPFRHPCCMAYFFIKFHLRISFNLGHQTIQNLSLVDRFRGSKKIFLTFSSFFTLELLGNALLISIYSSQISK